MDWPDDLPAWPLHPHPALPAPHGVSVTGGAARVGGRLDLTFIVRGMAADLMLAPHDAAAPRRDGLWQTTCFEAFLRCDVMAPAYVELNLAPSTAWAAYGFAGYRAASPDLPPVPPPRIRMTSGRDAVRLTAMVDLAALPLLPAAAPWRIGLAAVLAAQDGTRSWWALAHGAAAPDFHHRDCFARTLAAPDAP